MRMTLKKANRNQINRETIEKILTEEDRYFMDCHHRQPIGRESEDVIDNAYSRLLHIQKLPYLTVSNVYNEMRCAHA